MSARPLLILTCLACFGLSTTLGCGDGEETEDAPAAKSEKAAKGAKGAKGSKGGSSGGESTGGMTGSSDRRVVEVDAAPDVVPLGEASEITDPGSVTAGACETYIDCVCNLDTARRAANPDDAGEPDCAAARAEFTNHPELDGICHERLRSYKSWIESHNLFEDEGISVPASCL